MAVRTVTALRAHRKKLIRVYLDGEYAFSVRPNLAKGLQVGEELETELIESLRQKDAFEAARDRALHFLSFRPRSEDEVRRFLTKKGCDSAVVSDVLKRLGDAALLNDAQFAAFWVENRETFRPKGLFGLRYELREKGVADDIIDEALAGLNPAQSAYRAAAPRAARMAHLERDVFFRRLTGFLQRRGFAYEVIGATVRKLWDEMNDENQESDTV